MRRISAAASVAASAVLGLWFASAPMAQQQKVLEIGEMCDRTGPTQLVGVNLCPAVQDYVNLLNSKGGVEGYTITAREIDNEYKVPPAVESYERFKAEGAVSVMLYGTPQTQALTQRLNEDKVPGTSPGFGTSAAANGARYPYLFPIAASYWSQSAAALQFIKERVGGSLAGKKIAYLYYDNPAGHEPMPIIEEIQKIEKFELRSFAVPPPGVEMGAQVLDIAQRYRPDFVIAHLFGRSPSVAMKELKRAGYPLSKAIGLVWASAEADIEPLHAAARRQGKKVTVHLKINTGMARFGVEPEAALPIAERIRQQPYLELEGAFTHFADATLEAAQPTQEQFYDFQQLLEELAPDHQTTLSLRQFGGAGALSRNALGGGATRHSALRPVSRPIRGHRR